MTQQLGPPATTGHPSPFLVRSLKRCDGARIGVARQADMQSRAGCTLRVRVSDNDAGVVHGTSAARLAASRGCVPAAHDAVDRAVLGVACNSLRSGSAGATSSGAIGRARRGILDGITNKGDVATATCSAAVASVGDVPGTQHTVLRANVHVAPLSGRVVGARSAAVSRLGLDGSLQQLSASTAVLVARAHWDPVGHDAVNRARESVARLIVRQVGLARSTAIRWSRGDVAGPGLYAGITARSGAVGLWCPVGVRTVDRA